jgi:hypothetical protein
MIVAVPAAIPLTKPTATVATPVLLLLHTPPVVASLRLSVPLVHNGALPVMADTVGVVTTVTGAVAVAVPQLLVIV